MNREAEKRNCDMIANKGSENGLVKERIGSLKKALLRRLGVSDETIKEIEQIELLRKLLKRTWSTTPLKLKMMIILISLIFFLGLGLLAPYDAIIFMYYLGGLYSLFIIILVGRNLIKQEGKLIPLSTRSPIIFSMLYFHQLTMIFTFYSTAIILLPKFLLVEEWSVLKSLSIWLIFAAFFTLIFLFTLFLGLLFNDIGKLAKFLPKPWRTLVTWINIIWIFLAVIVPLILLSILDPEQMISAVMYFPPSAPFLIPAWIAYEFIRDPGLTPTFLTAFGGIIVLYLITMAIVLKVELYLAIHPPFPSETDLNNNLESIRRSNQLSHGEDGDKQDLIRLINKKPENTEKLWKFKLEPGAKAFESRFAYERMKKGGAGLRIWTFVFLLPLFLAIIVSFGLMHPVIFTTTMGLVWLMALTLPDRSILHGSDWLKDPWLETFRLIPAKKEEIITIFSTEARNQFRRNVVWVAGFHMTALFLLLVFLHMEGEKVPLYRFLVMNLVAIPAIAFLISRAYLLGQAADRDHYHLKKNYGDEMFSTMGIMILALTDIMIVTFLMIWNANPRVLLFILGLNIGFYVYIWLAYRTNFSLIFRETIPKKRLIAGRIICIIVIIITAKLMYDLSFQGDINMLGLEFPEDDDPVYLEGNYFDEDLLFESDAVIEGSATIENCTIYFEDDFTHTYVLAVKEEGSLKIMNTTMDANYFFIFAVNGDLTMENVTVQNAGGNMFQNFFIGGLFISGNATLNNCRILDSGTSAVYVSEGKLLIKNSIVAKNDKYGIEAYNSQVDVDNCIFSWNGASNDIRLRDCNGSVVKSSFPDGKWKAIADRDSDIFKEFNNIAEYEDEGWGISINWVMVWSFIALFAIAAYTSGKVSDREKKRLYEKYDLHLVPELPPSISGVKVKKRKKR